MKTYTLADSAQFVVIRKARKEYHCIAEWAHDRTIRAGEQYARIKITPGMGSGWSEETVHVDCLDPA
jgi:hypothetical protein